MALAISTQELDDFARLLTAAGVTSIETTWRGVTCQFTDGMEQAAGEALKVLLDRLKTIGGYDPRKAFVERLSEATKELAKQQKQQHEAAVAVRH